MIKRYHLVISAILGMFVGFMLLSSLEVLHLGHLSTSVADHPQVQSDQRVIDPRVHIQQIDTSLDNDNLLIPTNITVLKTIWNLGVIPNLPTIVSSGRLFLTAYLAYDVLLRNVAGDFVETGVFTGGSTVVMYKSIISFSKRSRRLFACDSFEGLPPPTSDDQHGTQIIGEAGQFRAGLQVFMDNMRKFDAADSDVLIPVKGWFQDSLPTMVDQYKVESISFLRLDGDLYVSTYMPLLHLYSKVSPGGIIYVDDYFSFNGCRKVVDVFRAQNNITAELHIQPFSERGDISTTDSEAGPRQLIERMLIVKYGFYADIHGKGKTEAVWWRKE